MLNGKVKIFKEDKGFGFIIDEKTGAEIFVHVSGLVDKVEAGESVTYDVIDGRKGKNAVNVKRA